MKKTYKKPDLSIDLFDVENVITVSVPESPVQRIIDTVGGVMEEMVDMFNSLGQ